MEIRPKFDTSTIKFSAPIINKTLESKVKNDPSGLIPNGIYKVIHWEKIRQLVVLIFSFLLFLAGTIWFILFLVVYKTKWPSFILPTILILLSGYKSLSTYSEWSNLKKSITRYYEDLKMGSTSTPPFIIRIYSNTFKKQVAHNWLTFFLLLHGGIFVILLWLLKDKHWWIFHFDDWIRSLFHNANTMIWIFTAMIILISITHIFMAIQRKKRISEIDAYFGQMIVPLSEVESLKQSRNKFYFRLFIIYIIIVLVIPLLVKIILRVLRRRK